MFLKRHQSLQGRAVPGPAAGCTGHSGSPLFTHNQQHNPPTATEGDTPQQAEVLLTQCWGSALSQQHESEKKKLQLCSSVPQWMWGASFEVIKKMWLTISREITKQCCALGCTCWQTRYCSLWCAASFSCCCCLASTKVWLAIDSVLLLPDSCHYGMSNQLGYFTARASTCNKTMLSSWNNWNYCDASITWLLCWVIFSARSPVTSPVQAGPGALRARCAWCGPTGTWRYRLLLQVVQVKKPTAIQK